MDGKLIAEAAVALLPLSNPGKYIFLLLSCELLDSVSTNSIADRLERPEPWNAEFIPSVMDKMNTASDKSNHRQQSCFAGEEKISQEISKQPCQRNGYNRIVSQRPVSLKIEALAQQ